MLKLEYYIYSLFYQTTQWSSTVIEKKNKEFVLTKVILGFFLFHFFLFSTVVHDIHAWDYGGARRTFYFSRFVSRTMMVGFYYFMRLYDAIMWYNLEQICPKARSLLVVICPYLIIFLSVKIHMLHPAIWNMKTFHKTSNSLNSWIRLVAKYNLFVGCHAVFFLFYCWSTTLPSLVSDNNSFNIQENDI